MKTTIKTIILAVATIFAAMSCQKETAVPGTQDRINTGETIQVNINASLGDFVSADGTKATATPVVRLEWAESDKVDAYYDTDKISGDARISVTPSDNKIFAKLEGTITAPSGHTFGDNDIITFVYSNVTGTNLTFDFSSQGTTIPFVAYATIKYSDLTSQFSDKMVEFKFATSAMKIAATNLGGGDISSATISGINTKVTLTPQTNSETVTIEGNTSGTITKNAGFDASTDKTRAIFTVGLVPDANTGTGRKISAVQGETTFEADFTAEALDESASYVSVYALKEVIDYVVMKMGTGGTRTLKWATKNLGATTVAGSGETCYGHYYAWGETKPYYATREWDSTDKKWNFETWYLYKSDGYHWNSYCENTDNCFTEWAPTPYDATSKTLKADKDVAKVKLGNGWRMPTSQEFKELADACGGKDKYDISTKPGKDTSVGQGIYWCNNYDGVAGCLFCDGTNKLFFPAAGNGNALLLEVANAQGLYWSSSHHTSYDNYAHRLWFDFTDVKPQDDDIRYDGLSVRPVSD